MKKTEAQELATKLVDALASYEKTEADDTSKEYKLKEGQTVDDFVFDRTENHIYRFLELGYTLVGAGSTKKEAKAQVVDVIASDLYAGNLVLSDTWLEDNIENVKELTDTSEKQ
jgi:hypothetical protein